MIGACSTPEDFNFPSLFNSIDRDLDENMVFVSNGAERNEEILASTAAVLLPTVSSVFGPGIVRDSKGCIILLNQAMWQASIHGAPMPVVRGEL